MPRSVNIVNEAKKTIEIHKIDKFSSFHNFKVEKDGIRMWKAFGIGPGKFISSNNIYVSHQQSTELETPSTEVFFEFSGLRELKQLNRDVWKYLTNFLIYNCIWMLGFTRATAGTTKQHMILFDDSGPRNFRPSKNQMPLVSLTKLQNHLVIMKSTRSKKEDGC